MENKSVADFTYENDGYIVENVGAIVALIVGVAIATLTLIFVGVLGGQTYEVVEPEIDLLTGTVVNESMGTVIMGTPVTLANDDVINLVVVNSTGGNVIPAGNYTLDADAGIFNLTNAWANNTAMNASYDWGEWNMTGYIKDAIISGFKALSTTGSYLPIVVLAVIIFIVLSIVMGLGAFGGMGGGQRYGGAL